jgi:nucleoside 2-deoxyribosyltransferase
MLVNMKAYIAGPLFNEAEKAFNLKVDASLQSLGIQTYLPQRDGGESIRLIKQGQSPELVRRRLFELDVTEIRTCDLFISILDGRVPDEGTCVELGMAFILGKISIGYQTDSRRFAMDYNNLMIDNTLTGGVAHSLDELSTLVQSSIQKINEQKLNGSNRT